MKKDIAKHLAFHSALRELRKQFEEEYNYLQQVSGVRPWRDVPEPSGETKVKVQDLFTKHLDATQKELKEG